MPRGATAEIGDTFVNQNGYHHTKTETGWKATHVIRMEEKLGRPLLKHEFVKFIDGDRTNLDISNLELRVRGDRKGPQARIDVIDAQIEELQAEREELVKILKSQ
jgi:hypothetical protein